LTKPDGTYARRTKWELPDVPLVDPTKKPAPAESEVEDQVRVHFLAACSIVMDLMDIGALDEARTVQADITAWVRHHTAKLG
jgi:hypothetical protein